MKHKHALRVMAFLLVAILGMVVTALWPAPKVRWVGIALTSASPIYGSQSLADFVVTNAGAKPVRLNVFMRDLRTNRRFDLGAMNSYSLDAFTNRALQLRGLSPTDPWRICTDVFEPAGPFTKGKFAVRRLWAFLRGKAAFSGIWLLNSVPPTYEVSGPEVPGIALVARVATDARLTMRAAATAVIPVPGAAAVPDPREQMDRAQRVTIAGIVRDPAGKPATDVLLKALPERSFDFAGLKTDDRGQFEIAWDPRSLGQFFHACLFALDPARNLAAARDIDETTRTLELRLEPSLVISGQVRDATNQPIVGASLAVYVQTGTLGSPFGTPPGQTDAQGQFEMSGFPKGRLYTVRANAKGYGSSWPRVREVPGTNRVELPPIVLKLANRQVAGHVVDENEEPVAGATVSLFGPGQPEGSARTDDHGRFFFDQVCPGEVHLSAIYVQDLGEVTGLGGDSNLVVLLRDRFRPPRPATPEPIALKGKSLPDLSVAGFAEDTAAAGKPILLCLFDFGQRPSRRALRLLADKHEALRQQGITVLAVHTAPTTAETFKTWTEASPLPFPVGYVRERSENTRWLTAAPALPWLILTDANRRVAAEGFAFGDLDATVNTLSK
jgi:hypothetical protein